MATQKKYWGRVFADGDPNYRIIGGPGMWSLMIEAFAQGKPVEFTFADRHDPRADPFMLSVLITAMWPKDSQHRDTKPWFIRANIVATNEEVVLLYMPKFHPSYQGQPRGHITCMLAQNTVQISPKTVWELAHNILPKAGNLYDVECQIAMDRELVVPAATLKLLAEQCRETAEELKALNP